jgi:hypothetical protein
VHKAYICQPTVYEMWDPLDVSQPYVRSRPVAMRAFALYIPCSFPCLMIHLHVIHTASQVRKPNKLCVHFPSYLLSTLFHRPTYFILIHFPFFLYSFLVKFFFSFYIHYFLFIHFPVLCLYLLCVYLTLYICFINIYFILDLLLHCFFSVSPCS